MALANAALNLQVPYAMELVNIGKCGVACLYAKLSIDHSNKVCFINLVCYESDFLLALKETYTQVATLFFVCSRCHLELL